MLETPGKSNLRSTRSNYHLHAGSDLVDADARTGTQWKQGSKETRCLAQMLLLSDSSFRYKFYSVLKGWAEERRKRKKRKH